MGKLDLFEVQLCESPRRGPTRVYEGPRRGPTWLAPGEEGSPSLRGRGMGGVADVTWG